MVVMTFRSILRFAVLLLSLSWTGHAFTVTCLLSIPRGRRCGTKPGSAATGSKLHGSSAGFAFPDYFLQEEYGRHDETAYRYMLAKARECAYSDAAAPSDASAFLNRILEMEGMCAGGLLAGRDLCDNVDDVAELVAHLRLRARAGATSDEAYGASLRYVIHLCLGIDGNPHRTSHNRFLIHANPFSEFVPVVVFRLWQ
jgi:hypothetical protein